MKTKIDIETWERKEHFRFFTQFDEPFFGVCVNVARSFKFKDCIPKISFGKLVEENGKKVMPVSIHTHHALMDGYHVALYLERFQELLNR